MTQNTLRQLIDGAAAAIRTYKHPDISECRERLDEILTAAGLGSIGSDHLTYLTLSHGTVTINTEYSVRGCEQSDEYEFPDFIIDAADPVKAATLWGAEQRTKKAKHEVDVARRALSLSESALAKAEAELNSALAA